MLSMGSEAGLSAPRAAVDPDWWRGAVIYQIYPRSFFDSDGNGVGDLAGVTAKLDHVASLGVDAIWLSPFYTSPMQDFGYDVADYRDVDPLFGTLADFDALVAAAHARGLRVIIDLVISHTSDRHPWFVESRASRHGPRADWYVWAEAKPDGTPPNNWLSVFGGSAWEWDTRRGQYYMHNFLASQPDLNFHNREVQDAVLDVARFWLERGVDGFRLDTVNFYFHDAELRDNPPVPPSREASIVPSANPYGRQIHLYDRDRPENLAFLERLWTLLSEYPGAVAVGELSTDEDLHRMMGEYTARDRRLQMAYSFELLTRQGSAAYIRRCIQALEDGIGTGWPSWALSNHDVPRVVSRWGGGEDPDRFGPLAVALVTSLRGSPCLYQGEELGLTEADVPYDRLQDPYGKRFWPEFKGRDGCRTPMPWTSEDDFAGFSTTEPWLPVPPEHRARSVAAQEADPGSPLNRVRRFLAWRREQRPLTKGAIHLIEAEEPVLAFIRSEGRDRIFCAFCLARAPATLEVSGFGPLEPLTEAGFGGRLEGSRLVLGGWDAFFGRLTG